MAVSCRLKLGDHSRQRLFVRFPFVMSTYDATLGALLVVTIWFLAIGAVGLPVASDDP
jgi:hypothetical protein